MACRRIRSHFLMLKMSPRVPVMRKRTEKFIAVKITSAHIKLQERVAYLRVFRRNHEQLRAMTGPGGGLKALGFDTFNDADTDEEVRQAYEGLKSAPVLDVTTGKDASFLWHLRRSRLTGDW